MISLLMLDQGLLHQFPMHPGLLMNILMNQIYELNVNFRNITEEIICLTLSKLKFKSSVGKDNTYINESPKICNACYN